MDPYMLYCHYHNIELTDATFTFKLGQKIDIDKLEHYFNKNHENDFVLIKILNSPKQLKTGCVIKDKNIKLCFKIFKCGSVIMHCKYKLATDIWCGKLMELIINTKCIENLPNISISDAKIEKINARSKIYSPIDIAMISELLKDQAMVHSNHNGLKIKIPENSTSILLSDNGSIAHIEEIEDQMDQFLRSLTFSSKNIFDIVNAHSYIYRILSPKKLN